MTSHSFHNSNSSTGLVFDKNNTLQTVLHKSNKKQFSSLVSNVSGNSHVSGNRVNGVYHHFGYQNNYEPNHKVQGSNNLERASSRGSISTFGGSHLKLPPTDICHSTADPNENSTLRDHETFYRNQSQNSIGQVQNSNRFQTIIRPANQPRLSKKNLVRSTSLQNDNSHIKNTFFTKNDKSKLRCGPKVIRKNSFNIINCGSPSGGAHNHSGIGFETKKSSIRLGCGGNSNKIQLNHTNSLNEDPRDLQLLNFINLNEKKTKGSGRESLRSNIINSVTNLNIISRGSEKKDKNSEGSISFRDNVSKKSGLVRGVSIGSTSEAVSINAKQRALIKASSQKAFQINESKDQQSINTIDSPSVPLRYPLVNNSVYNTSESKSSKKSSSQFSSSKNLKMDSTTNYSPLGKTSSKITRSSSKKSNKTRDPVGIVQQILDSQNVSDQPRKSAKEQASHYNNLIQAYQNHDINIHAEQFHQHIMKEYPNHEIKNKPLMSSKSSHAINGKNNLSGKQSMPGNSYPDDRSASTIQRPNDLQATISRTTSDPLINIVENLVVMPFNPEGWKEWYHLNATRRSTDKILAEHDCGTFLIRPSVRVPGDLVLAVTEPGKVKHYLIKIVVW